MTDAGKVCSGPMAAAAEAASAVPSEAEAAGEGWAGAVGVSRGGRGDNAGGPAVPCTSGWGDAPDEEEGEAGVASGEEEVLAAGTDSGKVYTAEQHWQLIDIAHSGIQSSEQAKPYSTHMSLLHN